jgi:hypothetical protein
MNERTVELSSYIVSELSRGNNRQKVIRTLKKRGWTESDASAYVDEMGHGIEGYDERLNDPITWAIRRRNYFWLMLGGLGLVGIGIFLLRFWGLVIICGVIVFIKGLTGWFKYR